MLKINKHYYKMIQIRVIRFLSLIWSKTFQIERYNKVLILSPHPDDEVIGCAGLVQKLLEQHKEVYVLMVTDGESAWDSSLIDSNELIAKRKALMLSAADIIGLPHEQYIHLGWPDGKLIEMAHNPEKQQELARMIDSIKPSMILLPHPYEISEDHNALNVALCNSLKINNYKMGIFYYWVHSIRPLRGFLLGWKKSFIIRLNKNEYQKKRLALDAYVKPVTSFGRPYSGDLYKSLLFSMKWNKEIFFEATNI